MIIHGGPGTGKSMTACLIVIYFLLLQKNVLMSAVTDIGTKSLAIHLVDELSSYHNQEKLLLIMQRMKDISGVKNYFLSEENREDLENYLDVRLKRLIKEN